MTERSGRGGQYQQHQYGNDSYQLEIGGRLVTVTPDQQEDRAEPDYVSRVRRHWVDQYGQVHDDQEVRDDGREIRNDNYYDEPDDVARAKSKNWGHSRQLNGRVMKVARCITSFTLYAGLASGAGYGGWHTALNALPLHSDSKGFNFNVGHDAKTFLDGDKLVLSTMKRVGEL